ncbi:MAG: hypothetical protein HYR94_02810 [Chloroflexi bacterium]|nr:hypothetical protein [Chloroflexota bacterium]
MQPGLDFDLQIVHKYFAAECFNAAWELMDKLQRTPEEDEEMIRLTHASLWHWSQREDCAHRNLAIGYWQMARVYALLGQADNSQRYAQLCLKHSQGEAPFYVGYAYEALARAEWIAGNLDQGKSYLLAAQELLVEVSDPEARELLEKDLSSLQETFTRTDRAL